MWHTWKRSWIHSFAMMMHTLDDSTTSIWGSTFSFWSFRGGRLTRGHWGCWRASTFSLLVIMMSSLEGKKSELKWFIINKTEHNQPEIPSDIISTQWYGWIKLRHLKKRNIFGNFNDFKLFQAYKITILAHF